jgi:hypothetical protein
LINWWFGQTGSVDFVVDGFSTMVSCQQLMRQAQWSRNMAVALDGSSAVEVAWAWRFPNLSNIIFEYYSDLFGMMILKWETVWDGLKTPINHHNQSRLEPMFLPGHIHPYSLEIYWDESSIAWWFPAPGLGVNCVFTTSRGGHNEHMLPLIPGLERH